MTNRHHNFPLTAEEFHCITNQGNKKFPYVMNFCDSIPMRDLSQKTKKYSLPFWPETLKDEIIKIISPENNLGEKLSLVLQLNLKDIQDKHFPGEGLLQFYIANNDITSNDPPEEHLMNLHSPIESSYQIIYIDKQYIDDKAVDFNDIETYLKAYSYDAKAHTLNINDDAYELPMSQHSMYHHLLKHGFKISDIKETMDDYFNRETNINIDKEIKEVFQGKENLFKDVSKAIFTENIRHLNGNKIFGYPSYIKNDPRIKTETQYDCLLLQVDTTTNDQDYFQNIDGANTETPYIAVLMVNEEQLLEWKNNPTLNVRENINTHYTKQYLN